MLIAEAALRAYPPPNPSLPGRGVEEGQRGRRILPSLKGSGWGWVTAETLGGLQEDGATSGPVRVRLAPGRCPALTRQALGIHSASALRRPGRRRSGWVGAGPWPMPKDP
jgi:hypothetical protein